MSLRATPRRFDYFARRATSPDKRATPGRKAIRDLPLMEGADAQAHQEARRVDL